MILSSANSAGGVAKVFAEAMGHNKNESGVDEGGKGEGVDDGSSNKEKDVTNATKTPVSGSVSNIAGRAKVEEGSGNSKE